MTFNSDYFLDACINCGIPFAVPVSFNNQRRSDGKSYYCPNGHPQCYMETNELRPRKEKNVYAFLESAAPENPKLFFDPTVASVTRSEFGGAEACR